MIGNLFNKVKNILPSVASKITGKINNFTTSPTGIKLITHYEGLRLEAYQDQVGVWTIGFGTTSGVYEGMVISLDQATAFLQSDLKKFESDVKNMVKVSLTQNQFDALVSWTYNLGAGSLKSSSMLRALNEGKYTSVPSEMELWNRAGGQIVEGLVKRRHSEATLFSTGELDFES
jgi:lysozyme